MTVICLRDEGFNVFRVQQTTGAVTGHTDDTVTDSSKTWTTDEWQNHAVRFTSGNHNGRSYNIISNTATALTCTIPKGSAVSGENIGTGDGSTTAFNGTLADPVDPGTLSITDGVEIFTDNSDGTLTGDKGGSGTITYTTGAWSVTFNTAPVTDQAITADYDPVYNFNCDDGLANDDTFEIISPGEDLAENTTPPGSADLTDQDVSTVAVTKDEGFYLYLDTTGGETFAITALTGEGVTVSGAGWSADNWVGWKIEFTDGSLSGQGFFISSNTDDDIYSEGINLGTAGAQVGDHFNITGIFFIPVLNTTPPGSATLTDQDVSTVAVMNNEGFYLYLDTTGGETFAITALTGEGVTVSGAGWSADNWVGWKIEFTDGSLSGQGFFISSNTDDDIYSEGINLGTAGAQVGDHFNITDTFFIPVLNTTPPGSATLTDQPIITTASIQDAGFILYLDTLKGQVFTVSALVDGGVEDNTQSWTENGWVGYRIEFTSGALSGKAYIIAINSATNIHGQGVNFSDEGVNINDTFKIVPYFFLFVEDAVPGGAADLTDQDIEILVQHYDEGFWFYFVLVEETWGAPPVFGVRHGRGVGLSIHAATRFGFFSKGAAARGLK